jgi:hypothetical protein
MDQQGDRERVEVLQTQMAELTRQNLEAATQSSRELSEIRSTAMDFEYQLNRDADRYEDRHNRVVDENQKIRNALGEMQNELEAAKQKIEELEKAESNLVESQARILALEAVIERHGASVDQETVDQTDVAVDVSYPQDVIVEQSQSTFESTGQASNAAHGREILVSSPTPNDRPLIVGSHPLSSTPRMLEGNELFETPSNQAEIDQFDIQACETPQLDADASFSDIERMMIGAAGYKPQINALVGVEEDSLADMSGDTPQLNANAIQLDQMMIGAAGYTPQSNALIADALADSFVPPGVDVEDNVESPSGDSGVDDPSDSDDEEQGSEQGSDYDPIEVFAKRVVDDVMRKGSTVASGRVTDQEIGELIEEERVFVLALQRSLEGLTRQREQERLQEEESAKR